MGRCAAAGQAVVLIVFAVAKHGLALAQTPAAEKADRAAEAAAAMQRAQRLASNPMRVILEASKFKRKVAADSAPIEAADAASLRRPATHAGPDAEAVARDPAVAARPRVAVAEPAIAVTRSTLTAVDGPVPALDSSGTLRFDVAQMPLSAPALAAVAAAQPRLIDAVEPQFAGRLLDEAARLTEVLADLTLRPDGGVAEVVLLGTVPRALQRPIVAALAQWRFAPLPAQQTHRVQLVFSGTP